MTTVQSLLKVAQSFVGMSESSSQFKQLIDSYNAVKPLPMGYQVKYTDDWCDVFVTVVGDKAGATNLIGRECGVQRHILLFKNLGIWKGREFPKPGDIITFDWDGDGWADHIGFVESVNNNTVMTIERNSNQRVQRNKFTWNDKRIMGYARTKYANVSEVRKTIDEIAKEVVDGKWSNGQERIAQLLAAGYDAKVVQVKVNDILITTPNEVSGGNELVALKYNSATLPIKYVERIMELAKEYKILPSLLIVMLHYEGLWGDSNVANFDNNWGGMTWSENYEGNPKIKKRKGSRRPVAEGGHYIHYESVEDFIEDWVYLLRTNHIYKVTGKKTFAEAVKGLFKAGGAKYDYAALGYPKYAERISARKDGIEKANPGELARLDKIVDDFEMVDNDAVKVQVSSDAIHWQTGEVIALWVKGLEFDVLDTKTVSQEVYLLGSNGIDIGWLLASDVK